MFKQPSHLTSLKLPRISTNLAGQMVLLLGLAGLFYAIDYYIIVHTDLNNTDFSFLWAGGRAVTEGHSPYDHNAVANVYREIGHDRLDSAVGFPYPIWLILPFVLLSWLPFTAAAAAWAFSNQVLYIVTFWSVRQTILLVRPVSRVKPLVRRRFLTYYGPGLFMLTPHFIHSLLNGQTSFLMTALLALFTLWACRSLAQPAQTDVGRFYDVIRFFKTGPVLWAGLCLAAWLVKPPLVIVIVPLAGLWLIWRRAWQILVVAAAAGLGLIVVSFAIYPDWLAGWLSSRTTPGEDSFRNSNLWGLSYDLTSWAGWPALALPVGATLVAGLGLANLAIFWRRSADPLLILLAIYTFGLVATIYNHNYDMLTLFIPYLVLLDWSHDLTPWWRRMTRFSLALIIYIIPWLLNLQAIQSSAAGLYALMMNIFLLLFVCKLYPAHPKAGASNPAQPLTPSFQTSH